MHGSSGGYDKAMTAQARELTDHGNVLASVGGAAVVSFLPQQ